MVTLQEQIGRSLLQPRRGQANANMGPLNMQPMGLGSQGAACVQTDILGNPETQLCPTPWPIIRKTRTPGPPHPMVTFGNRGYAIAAFWATGTAMFMETADRQILALRKDGTVKLYRPRKHIVVSSNPRVKNLVRARDRIDNLSKRLRGAIGARAISSGRGKKR